MIKFYLAGRYSRRSELAGYGRELNSQGHFVTSRWLLGDHQIDESGKPLTEAGEQAFEDLENTNPEIIQIRHDFARHDLEDVTEADVILCFTEVPRSAEGNRGGRHVEFGYALGLYKPIVIIGHRENLFYWLPILPIFRTWRQFLEEGLSRIEEVHANNGGPIDYSFISPRIV